MKKFLITAAASVLIFGGQAGVEASTNVKNLDAQIIETQEASSKWSNFSKYLRERETDKERRKRKDWERSHRDTPPPPAPPKGSKYDSIPTPPPPPPAIFGTPTPGITTPTPGTGKMTPPPR